MLTTPKKTISTRSLAALGLGGVLLVSVSAGGAKRARAQEAPPTNLPVPAVPAVPPTPVAPPAGPDNTPTAPTNTTVAPIPYQQGDKVDTKPDTVGKRDGKKDGVDDSLRTKGTAEKLFGSFAREITITGGTNFTLRQDGVQGGAIATETYSQQNVNTLDQRQLGPFRQNMDVTITGRVFNAFNINARLSNSRYGNQFNQIFGINYKSKGTSFDAGNVNAALPGNNLVTFSRSLQGIIASRDFGKIGGYNFSTTGVASLTRAVTRKGSFQGNGTIGPYYMNASSIREGSEIVQIDGQQLQRDKDYRIDYLLGQLTFLGSRIVNAGNTVTFSYEAQNFNTTPGLLTGTRINVSGGRGLGYGVTYLQQKTTSQGTRNGITSDYFPVVSDLSQHYQLNNLIDPSAPVKVFYLDRQLTEGIDYSLNREQRFVLLRTAFPPDTAQNIGTLTSLRIEYKPIRQSSANGDRSIIGLDTVQRIGDMGTITLQFGQSKGESASQTGQAMTVSTAWHSQATKAKPGETRNEKRIPAWTANVGLKNVGVGFSPIESVASAFLQAERGGDAGFTFTPNQFIDISTNVRQSQVANVYQNATTTTTGVSAAPVWVTSQSLSTAINYRPINWPTLSLTHSQTGQNSGQATGTRSSYSNDALNASWSKGILGLTGALTRTATKGSSIFSNIFNNAVSSNTLATGIVQQAANGSFSQSVSNSTSDSSRLQISLNPAIGHGMLLGMTGEIGFSNTNNGAATDGAATSGNTARAKNNGLGINFTPFRDLQLSSTWNESSNGQSTAGFYDAGATSASGVIASQLTSTLTGQKTKATTYNLQYSPSARFALGYNSSRSLSLVPGYDNSENVANNWNVSGTPFPKLQLNLNLTDQKVNYVGGQGNSTNKSTTVTGTAGPFGRMSFTTQFTKMNFNSATYNSFGGGSVTGGSGTIAGIGDGGVVSTKAAALTRQSTTLPTTTGVGASAYTTGYLQNGTNTSWSLQTNYDVGANKSLFARFRSVNQGTPTAANLGDGTLTGGTGSLDTTYHSANNYYQSVATIGMELRLTDVVGFSLGVNILQQNDRDDARYSYRARTFNADLSARF